MATLGSPKYTPRPFGNTTESSSNRNRCLIATGAGVSFFFRFPFAGLLALYLGDLRRGYGMWQLLPLTDFDNIEDPYTLLNRGLSNNRRLDASNTKQTFRGVPSIFPARHSITRLYQVIDDSTLSFRQYVIPWVVNRVFADTTCDVYSTQQHRNPVVCNEIPLSGQRAPYIYFRARDSRVNGAATNGDAVKVQLKSGYLLCRATLKQRCQLQHLKLITMFTLLFTAKKTS